MSRSLASLLLLLALLVPTTGSADDFHTGQLKAVSVQAAVASKREIVKALFQKQGLAFPPRGVFLRVFKLDRELELWGQAGDGTYRLVKTYPICASSGEPGPKRTEGDGQVPEGFYSISAFNPYSAYHLSLGINYPNASDRARGHGRLGGSIMIHGNCVTIGCVPITDPMIEEVYLAAMEAKAGGQRAIDAHFFPGRLDDAGWRRLTTTLGTSDARLPFWRELKAGYDSFERTHRLPTIHIGEGGRYVVRDG